MERMTRNREKEGVDYHRGLAVQFHETPPGLTLKDELAARDLSASALALSSQKTFAIGAKVFWFFFSKKNCFLLP